MPRQRAVLKRCEECAHPLCVRIRQLEKEIELIEEVLRPAEIAAAALRKYRLRRPGATVPPKRRPPLGVMVEGRCFCPEPAPLTPLPDGTQFCAVCGKPIGRPYYG